MSEELVGPQISDSPFSLRARVILITISVLSLAGGFALALFGEDVSEPPTAGNNAYSSSAIGHEVAVDLLEELDIPVLISRHASGRKAQNAVLVLAEPEVDAGNSDQLVKMIESAGTVLVVLPKRTGYTDPRKPHWIDESELVSQETVENTLLAVTSAATVVRPAGSESPEWQLQWGLPAPTMVSPQLIESTELEPIAQTADGRILLGKLPVADVYILSDPDIIANHGIGQGDNALFWITMIEEIRHREAAVIVDQVIHGLQSKPSIWRTLFEFPLVLATIQVLLITAVLLWAMTRRFGKPVKSRGGLEPGKEFLIDNTAGLLHFGGYSSDMLLRYYRDTIRYVRARLHTPAVLVDSEAKRWLERVGTTRRVSESLASIESAVDSAVASRKTNNRQVAAAAARVHRWKEEMLHESPKRSAD